MPIAKTASKTRKKPLAKQEMSQPRFPIYGERVRRQGSDMEYEITYVPPDGRYVHIGIPRTDFEHRHVAVSALIFLEESCVPAKALRPPIDTAAAAKRLDCIAVQLTLLKKALKSKGLPPEAVEDLDSFCKEQEEAWDTIVAKIKRLLEE